MPKFQMVVPHDRAQCIEALAAAMAHDPDFQSQVWYGCHFGDCTGYALIEASSEEEAMGRIPRLLQDRARVVEVAQVTPEDLRSRHEKVT